MKSLVLAEKPSVARDIARVLNCRKNIPGALEGDQYVVTWALGHLVTLADPEEYDKKYTKWELEHLPIMPEKMRLVVIPQSAKQYGLVKTQLFRRDVGNVVIATDAGREGELVARWILEKSGCKKPVRRLWISSVTDKAIREGFAHLKDGKEYEDLYAAAQSRAEADWLVGINATRALTCKYNAQLSCGRVQTPTLSMVAAREEEIRRFVPEEYCGFCLQAGGVRFTWKNGSSYHTFSGEQADTLERALRQEQKNGKGLLIRSCVTAAKKTNAPALYDLTELQRDANRRFGYSAKETLNLMQGLYENHKVLTYPRTDCRYLSSDVADTLRERLRACAVGPYRKLAGTLAMKPIRRSSSYVDDRKVTDHHAIIPTEQVVDLAHMTNGERRIYDLVVRRFLAVLLPPFEYDQMTVTAQASGESFVARGKVIRSRGWKEAYEDERTDALWEEEEEADVPKEQTLPALIKGKMLPVTQVTRTTGKTAPPPYFTEATLLSAMENPVHYLEKKDGEAARTLGETGGLGTVATRADIIDKLFSSFLMEKRGSEIHVTGKGRQLLELVPEDLRRPELTAQWETKLTQISGGKLKKEVFLSEIERYTEEIVREIKAGTQTFHHENLTNRKCPKCGKRMLAVNGKNSKMLVCQDRECGWRETLSRTSNARCPNCHKKMELCGSGEEQVFVCSCGYKEKLSAFKQRREKEGAGVSRRDVQSYLNRQKKETEQPLNNAFADAFAKLGLQGEPKKK